MQTYDFRFDEKGILWLINPRFNIYLAALVQIMH